MAHLNYFGVKNFRIFEELKSFEFRPITVLVGANSTGKSSLTKAILSLKESLSNIKIDQTNSINTFPLNNINFQNDLNLGNFRKVKSEKSTSKIISFELPFPFASNPFPLIIKFDYQEADNSLKNGQLISFEIKDKANNLTVLSYDAENGYLRIMFSLMLGHLKEETIKSKKINELLRERQLIEADYTLNGEFLEDLLSFESKIKLQEIDSELEKIDYDENLQNFRTSGYTDSFKCPSIYSDKLYDPHLHFFPNASLFNYSFLYDEETLTLIQGELGISDLSIEEILKKNVTFWQKIGIPKRDFLQQLKQTEIEILDQITFERSSDFIDFLDLKDFTNLINKILPTDYDLKFTFFKKLIERYPIIHEVYFDNVLNYQSISKNVLLINSNNSYPFKNISYFLNDYVFKSILNGFRTLNLIFRNMNYIPSVRYKVERIILNNSNSYLQEVLIKIHQVKLSNTSINFIKKYILIFGISENISFEISEDSSTSKILLHNFDQKEELADIGYGISQIIPIILKLGLMIQENEPDPIFGDYFGDSSILIIEEPETNLHPALQSKLSDMLVECYEKYNIQFIIETHSEYLIRKLQYLVAKKDFKAEDTVIYNFRKATDDNPEIVKRIDIDEDGGLSTGFYPGFFDEALSWELELLKLKRSKSSLN